MRLRAPTGTRVENTEQLALRVLDVVKREVGADKIAITLGLVGVHAPNYPVNLIHLWNGGPRKRGSPCNSNPAARPSRS